MPEWVWLIVAIVGGVITTLAERRGKKQAADIAATVTRQLEAVVHGVERAGISDPTTGANVKSKIRTQAKVMGVERDLQKRVKQLTQELLK